MKKFSIALLTISIISLSALWATNKTNKSAENAQAKPSQVMELTPENAKTIISSFPTILVIDFYAEWCGPCRTIKPAFEEIAQEYKDRYSFAKINIDKCPDIAAELDIKSLPTFAVMSNGKIIDKIVGLQSKESLIEKINQAVKGPQDLSKLDKSALNEKLHQAIQGNASIEDIKRILDAGADVNAPASTNLTPLMMVIMFTSSRGIDCTQLVQLLLDHGAITEIIDPQTGQKNQMIDLVNMMGEQYKKISQNFEKLTKLFEEVAQKKQKTA